MTRYPPEHKQQTRHRILVACRQHVHQRGLGAGLEGVMSEVGLTKGGFYTHFKSKTALLTETLSIAFEQCQQSLLEHFREATSDREAIESVFDAYLSSAQLEDQDQGCLVPHCLSDLSRADDEVRTLFNNHRRWLTDQVADRLSGDQETRRETATAIVSAAIGATTLAQVETDALAKARILSSARRAVRALVASTEQQQERDYASHYGEPVLN